MTNGEDLRVRRKPVQARARATFEAILQAASELLIAEGFARMTTNRVAEQAGVSVGTLYQYFPNKEALLLALVDQHTEAMMLLLVERLSGLAQASVEEATREMVRAWLEAHAVNPELHRVVMEQFSLDFVMDRTHQVKARSRLVVRHYLELHREVLALDDLDMASFMVTTMVDAVTHTMVLEQPERLRSGDGLDRVVEHVCRMVLRYLLKEP
ncbi:MAG: TetR/AcrR family transcriptional regulator [Myxococcota bacterium]